MIPENRLSTALVADDWYLEKYDSAFTDTSGYELGGPSMFTTASELSSHIWYYYYEDDYIKMRREDTPNDVTSVIEVPNIQYLSVTFDQAMVPYFAYESAGITYLRWYDSTLQQYVTTDYGAEAKSPKVFLDIKDYKSDDSDVVFFYLKEYTTLCARYQRDRFQIEYTLAEVPPSRLLRVGLNKSNRVQLLAEEVPIIE